MGIYNWQTFGFYIMEQINCLQLDFGRDGGSMATVTISR
jgi:hypothetical protein